jgi:hypothetical protein
MPVVFSIVESPLHPDFSDMYRRLGYTELKLGSVRKAIQALKQQIPDLIVADFIYGYGSNYAGVNISNLDVFLYSLQKYKQDSRIILLVEKAEQQYVEKLKEIFPIHSVLVYPVKLSEMEQALKQ